MDFELSKSQKEIQKAAREFSRGEFDKEKILELEKDGVFPEDIWRSAAELGFIGIHFDESCGGGGLGLLEQTLLAEELCMKDSSMGSAIMLAGHASECLLRFGTDEQKRAWLPLVAEGKILSGGAFFEPGDVLDLSDIKTKAERDGESWVIRGSKTHVLNGGRAGFYVVLARTDGDVSPDKGCSMFLVEGDLPGISVKGLGPRLGCRMVASAEISFEGVRVPHENLIGKEGKGIYQAREYFNETRILFSAMAVGAAQGTLGRAVAYIKQREQFGRKIGVFEALQHMVADMAAGICSARLVTRFAALSFGRRKSDPSLPAMAGLEGVNRALSAADNAIQLLGGYGYMAEYEIEHFYRDIKAMGLFEGGSSQLKREIASAVIGKIS